MRTFPTGLETKSGELRGVFYERPIVSSLVYESIHNDDLTEVGRPVRATVYVEINTTSQAERERQTLLNRIEHSNEQEKRRN